MDNTIKKNVKCVLTDAEKQQAGFDLAEAFLELNRGKNDLKSVTAQYKSRIAQVEASISDKSSMLSSGYEFRDIECEVIKNYDDRIIRIIRPDTGEVVEERMMAHDELQMHIDELRQKKL